MKIVQLNATCGIGSTGKICTGIASLLEDENVENYILYTGKTDGNDVGINYSNKQYLKLQALKSRLLGNYGFNSRLATKKLIDHLKRINPDIVHIHNIHGHDCDLGLLFKYFKKDNIKLLWTFHDCWAFTGYCPHFTAVGCEKWKECCEGCIQRKDYSWIFDRSKRLYNRKKMLFSGLNLTIVTPSEWLAGLVSESFLKDYKVKVINNGIDTEVFKPVESGFRAKYGLEDKKIILGVSFVWGVKKGLDVFVELSRRLGEDYKIVLVGTNNAIDKQLPDNIISIHRTNNQQELAEIYSAADVFVNPTREENFPTVNIESLACGTPVVTFKTGGSPEIIDNTCGSVVECDDVDALEKEIKRICIEKPYSTEACRMRAEHFNKNEKFEEYINLYKEMLDDRASKG